MDKRKRNLLAQIKAEGLELEGGLGTSGGNHYTAVLRRADGATQRASFSLTPSVARTAMEQRATLRRFARGCVHTTQTAGGVK
jgi:hypothetical protein